MIGKTLEQGPAGADLAFQRCDLRFSGPHGHQLAAMSWWS
jgi:hypothetical protein